MHRKIVLCDGTLGFVGGINVCDAQDEAFAGNAAYRDTHVRLAGAAVCWLQVVFFEDWVYARCSKKQLPQLTDLVVDSPAGPIGEQIVASGPDNAGEAVHRAVLDSVHSAQHRIWMAMPYFVSTEPVLYALVGAAQRGLDVRLPMPRRSDSRPVTSAARSYFDELGCAGVQVERISAAHDARQDAAGRRPVGAGRQRQLRPSQLPAQLLDRGVRRDHQRWPRASNTI